MELPELNSKYNLKANGILHVGAHLAEEAEIYSEVFGVDTEVWWIEANPRVAPKIENKLRRFPHQRLIQALVYETDGVELDFNVTNYDGMSSSILKFGTHTSFSPDVVFEETIKLSSRSVDSLVAEHGIAANFLNMDLQGAEMFALSGSHEFIKGVDYVLTEVNKKEVYVGCAQVGQIDEFLSDFERVETYWVADQGWGDALYVRRGL